MGILNTVFVIIGAIIGAGFASGKEIYTFFFIYGRYGFIGFILSLILIGGIIYKSLKIIQKYNINSYDEFLKLIVPKNKKINIGIILNYIVNLFLLTTFFVMCAGFCAYFKQELGINEIYSGIIIASFSYVILNKNLRGIFLVNSILIPIIIAILLVLGIKSMGGINTIQYGLDTKAWLPKAILYASYNTIELMVILIPMKKYVKRNKDILKISILSILIIGILGLIIFMLLLNIKMDISEIQLPAVYASRTFWKYV